MRLVMEMERVARPEVSVCPLDLGSGVTEELHLLSTRCLNETDSSSSKPRITTK